MKRRTRFCVCLIVLLFAFMAASPAALAEETAQPAGAVRGRGQYRILFLSSNALGFPPVESQITGVREALGDKATLTYEFMDVQAYNDTEAIAAFWTFLQSKLAREGPLDAVIAGDDAALELVLEHQEVFSGIPVVFEGVDDETRAQRAVAVGMTGVEESGTVEANLKLATVIYPKADRILAVIDDSATALGQLDTLRQCAAAYPALTLEVLDTTQFTQEQIVSQLQTVDTDTLLFLLSCHRDGEGRFYAHPYGLDLVLENAAAPVFYYPASVGDGSLGGIMVDFEAMGRLAGEMTLQLLEGASVEEVPPVKDTPTQTIFDAAVLREYGISRELLPAGAKYLNDTQEQEDLRQQLMLTTVLISGLVILLGCLIFDNYRKRCRETELLASRERLRREAEHDALTGLCNRRRFADALKNCVKNQTEVTVVSLDVDDFKVINDNYGHQAGDEVLKELGRRLQALLGEGVSAYRNGGDEFAVIMRLPQSDAGNMLGRVGQVFEAPFEADGKTLTVHGSVGVASYPADADTVETLLACADAALYCAKRSGKNGVCRYGDLNEAQRRSAEEAVPKAPL